MGKLNVAVLRYLSREDFRVLTAVLNLLFIKLLTSNVYLLNSSIFSDRNGNEEPRAGTWLSSCVHRKFTTRRSS